MATSQNGYPVLFSNRTTGVLPRLRKWIIPGTNRHLYLRDGSVGFVIVHFAMWWHKWVSPLDGGIWDEWGWAVRPIRGQSSGYSNHASATAADLDATQYPRGIAVALRMKVLVMVRIRARLKLYRGVLGWGGDYRNTPDGMHVEVIRPIGDVEKVARRLMNTPRGRAILAANPGARQVIES